METSASTSDKALFFGPYHSAQAVAIDKLLATSNRMRVQFTPFNANPVVATFNIRGFDRYIDEVLAACPAFDESKWAVYPGLRRAPR